MDKYNLRSSKHLWAVFLTAGLFVPGWYKEQQSKLYQKLSVCLLKRR